MELLQIYLLGVFATLILIVIEHKKEQPKTKTTIGDLLVYFLLLTLSWVALVLWLILNHEYIGNKWQKFVNTELF